MTQLEMTKKMLGAIDDFMPDDVHSEDNMFREIESSLLAVIATNLAVIADELKKERK
jgi:hypothetical protein